MKTFRLVAIAFLLASSGKANVFIPRAKLAGETVQVRLSEGTAAVTAIFDFEELWTRDEKVIYFPIFSADSDDPIRVLAETKFELEIDRKNAGVALPCEAPRAFAKAPSGTRVCWFVVNLDKVVTDAEFYSDRPLIVKFTYFQPLVHKKFYYLPVITGYDDLGRKKRTWQFQMHARSPNRMVRVLSTGTDYEQLDDGLIVYLKNGELVELE